jgi:TatD DNase family protein
MLIDFHTHHQEHTANIKKHFNIIIPEDGAGEQYDIHEGLFSAGIHPWYISGSGFKEQLEVLRNLLKNQNVRVLGECGIDKLKGPPLQIQEEVFVKQIRMAEEFKKPMVLHIVKAFNELISIKKVMRPKVPMVVHGFVRKPELAMQLIEKGFYLSLGADLLVENSNSQQVLKQMDKAKLFLETDDSKESIESVYKKACEVLNVPQQELEDRVYENYLGLYS